MTIGPEDPLSESAVEASVHAVRPEWEVDDGIWCADGSDTLYYVTVETDDGPREIVLKVCTYADPEEFRTEPYLLDAIAERTSIPVPEVFGTVDDHADLTTPFFVMERCFGERVSGSDLEVDALGRVAFEAGQNLGELHALGSFDRYGYLSCQRDDPDVRPGVEGDDYVLGVADGTDSWREWLLGEVEPLFADIDEPFRDLEDDLRAFAEDGADLLESDGPPELIDPDYWYGNVLVDAESGETKHVLDFGKTHTGTAEYNLVLTEQFLCEFAPLDSERRRRVRNRLLAGYERTNSLDRSERFEDRRDYYLLLTWLGPLVLFEEWYADEYEATPDEQEARYREAISTLLSRL